MEQFRWVLPTILELEHKAASVDSPVSQMALAKGPLMMGGCADQIPARTSHENRTHHPQPFASKWVRGVLLQAALHRPNANAGVLSTMSVDSGMSVTGTSFSAKSYGD